MMVHFLCGILYSSLLWLFVFASQAHCIPIHFSYITAKSGGFLTSGVIPAVDLALEQINNRTDILPNYTLSYTTILDSKCDVTAALDAFNGDFIDVEVTQNKTNPTYLSLLCCGCSTATIPVAQISHYWNIPHVAFAAAASVLNDRQKFRSFFRTVPLLEFIPKAVVQIAMKFRWRQVAAITQTESLFTSITNNIAALFEQNGLILDTTIKIDTSFSDKMFNLNAQGDYRIYVIHAYPNVALSVLCQAYHRNMTAPKYVWITPSWFEDNWWKANPGNRNCTPEIMAQILNGSLAIGPKGAFLLENNSDVTTSGLTPRNFRKEYENLLTDTARYQNLSKHSSAGLGFDAVWSIAVGLHNASEKVKINDSSGCDHLPGELVPLEEFSYRNQRMGCVLQKSIAEVNITGVTGTIAFDSNGSRTDNNEIVLTQYRTKSLSTEILKIVANIVIHPNNSASSFKFISEEREGTLWSGGAPYDGSPVDAIHHNHVALVTIYSTLTTAGLVYTLTCLVFNTLFRNKRMLKLSSPNLNYLIISGAGLLYICVYMYVFTVDGKNQTVAQTVICNLRQWFYTLGYTLCFAVILAKTWRVYHIFTNPHPNKKVIKDWVLIIFVVVVVAGDLLITTIGIAVPSSRFNATITRDIQHPTSVTPENTNIRYFIYTCIQPSTIIWLAVSYAYKGLLQLVAMFMAFHTRRVKIKALNDSKEIAFIIYINSISLVLLAVVEFALNTYHEVYAALFGLGLMVAATLFLTLVFVPKMVSLCKDPEGRNVFSDPSGTQDQKLGTVPATKPEPSQDNDLTSLRKRIAELENEIAMNS